ncbi:hypothetical protein B0J11DRAFT_544602 [Dendryphion nanum]|uniref:Secreted protein n=1 Tax=Dendryphion nanum TaxID=256645 RepID=A0A9P9D090_9PLEO|nr:hypothetical protein B0J11DRAFT_544602 [Dendryphion nanum]
MYPLYKVKRVWLRVIWVARVGWVEAMSGQMGCRPDCSCLDHWLQFHTALMQPLPRIARFKRGYAGREGKKENEKK